MSEQLVLECDPVSTNGQIRCRVTARLGEKVVGFDTINLGSHKSRSPFVKRVAQATDLNEEEIDRQLIEAGTKQLQDKEDDRGKEVDPLEATPQEVIDEALGVLKSPDLFEQISSDIADIGIAGEKTLALTLYCIMTSRLLDRPLSGIIQGASSSGKSYILETVAELMPPEAVVQAHDFTDQVFYYMEEGSLQHKAVISGERLHDQRGKHGEAQDNTKAFREMVGSGCLRKAVTVTVDGKPTCHMIVQPGPIAFLETTTASKIQDEDATRLLPLVTDESPGQTKMIMEALRRKAQGRGADEKRRKAIILLHNTMQRLLKRIDVRIPFIDSLSLPETNIATRRSYGHLISMIQTVALLRQYQKPIGKDAKGLECMEADENDYEIAYRLMTSILSRTYSPLNQKSRDLLEVLLQKTKLGTIKDYQSFTNQDCQSWTGLSEPTIRRRLWDLVWVGIISVDKSSKPYVHRVEKPELAESMDVGLPDPEVIAERIAIMSE